MNVKELMDQQQLVYCKLDLCEVTFVKSHNNNSTRVVAKFPPHNIQCFTDLSNLYLTNKHAIDALIKRIEVIEGIKLNQRIRDKKIIKSSNEGLFDTEDKNVSFNQLIESLTERIMKLENICKNSIG